ncbi:hypothetical protein [Thalassovita sp.]|uniref:hypothetical protein n=1 Tax=Thalassovita sp. TaxID=1979401 RepID=UPI002B265396|nr:hypothetical protein [Thalassovita sp.]
MTTPYQVLIRNIALTFATLSASTSLGQADVLQLEERALIVCESIGEAKRTQRITEATGQLPGYGQHRCWKVSPPAEVLVIERIGTFTSIVYRNRIYKEWSPTTPAWLPQTWLDGSTGVIFRD